MKKKLFLIILILLSGRMINSAPIAGVSTITGDSQRAASVAILIEQHILTILKNKSFDTIAPEMISKELTKFNCTEEKCFLKFATDAGIDLLVAGTVTDRKDYLLIKLQSYGINIPFNSRIIAMYEIKLTFDVDINAREFSLLSEEHAAEFLAKTLNSFVYPLKIKADGNKFTIQDELKPAGKFSLYSADRYGFVKHKGEVNISGGDVIYVSGEMPCENDFVLFPFKNKSAEIKSYYTGRKNEIVFEKKSFYDTLFVIAVTPIASATMPLSSPYLGYYMNNDWQGLGLWMINAPPYLYMEARGFIISPEKLKEKKEDISRDDKALNYFAWYMLLSGGMPLFIDSYANTSLHKASYFKGEGELTGNTLTAAVLSLTSNGSGHFYRGHRYWGYFYFHINNILLYLTLREFSAPEYYDASSDSYTKGNINKQKRNLYCSVFAVSKAIELVHAIMTGDSISSGEIIEQYIIPEPYFTFNDKGSPEFGINVTFRF
jgi:hypothetical protein